MNERTKTFWKSKDGRGTSRVHRVYSDNSYAAEPYMVYYWYMYNQLLNVYSHTLDHGFQWPNGYCTELELGKYLVSGQFALAEETYASLVAIIF